MISRTFQPTSHAKARSTTGVVLQRGASRSTVPSTTSLGLRQSQPAEMHRIQSCELAVQREPTNDEKKLPLDLTEATKRAVEETSEEEEVGGAATDFRPILSMQKYSVPAPQSLLNTLNYQQIAAVAITQELASRTAGYVPALVGRDVLQAILDEIGQQVAGKSRLSSAATSLTTGFVGQSLLSKDNPPISGGAMVGGLKSAGLGAALSLVIPGPASEKWQVKFSLTPDFNDLSKSTGAVGISINLDALSASSSPKRIQPKLKVNRPGDEYEQEADRVADQVMRMPEPQVQRQCSCGKTLSDDECSECKKKKQGDRLQRVESSPIGGISAPHIVDRVLSSPGSPLPTSNRSFMESRIGQDFSHVRVHTDQQAAQSASAVKARAYTVGNHIVFGSGEHPARDQRLLAHELAHVLQQQGAQEVDGDSFRLQRAPSQAAERSTFDLCWKVWEADCEFSPLEAVEYAIDSLGSAWKEYVDRNIDKIIDIIRQLIPEGPARTAVDVVIGIRQGAVEFIEGIVAGVFSLLKKSTWKGLAALVARIKTEGFDFIVDLIAQAVRQTIGEFEKEIAEAQVSGKVAQVRAKWATRIIAEVVSLIIPAAVAAKGAKAGTAAKVAEGTSSAAKSGEALADVSKVAKSGEAVTDIGKATRESEAIGESTKVAHAPETAATEAASQSEPASLASKSEPSVDDGALTNVYDFKTGKRLSQAEANKLPASKYIEPTKTLTATKTHAANRARFWRHANTAFREEEAANPNSLLVKWYRKSKEQLELHAGRTAGIKTGVPEKVGIESAARNVGMRSHLEKRPLATVNRYYGIRVGTKLVPFEESLVKQLIRDEIITRSQVGPEITGFSPKSVLSSALE
jgi:hypothetical protein